MSGKLIVISGTDGSGKATQTKALVERLTQEGLTVRTLDFPQYESNFFGRLLKKGLKNKYGDFIALDPHIACPLYAADRFESKPKIEKWLDDGNIVILDRYVSANQIHQGGKIQDEIERRKFMKWLGKMEYEIFGLPKPDKVIFLDVPTETTQKLLHKQNKEKDAAEKNIDYLKDSRKCALWLTEQNENWEKVSCVDGKNKILPIEEIHEKVYSIVNELINNG